MPLAFAPIYSMDIVEQEAPEAEADLCAGSGDPQRETATCGATEAAGLSVLRLRGLPFYAKPEDVREWSAGLGYKLAAVVIAKWNGEFSLEHLAGGMFCQQFFISADIGGLLLLLLLLLLLMQGRARGKHT